jgi:hypothetical protein
VRTSGCGGALSVVVAPSVAGSLGLRRYRRRGGSLQRLRGLEKGKVILSLARARSRDDVVERSRCTYPSIGTRRPLLEGSLTLGGLRARHQTLGGEVS